MNLNPKLKVNANVADNINHAFSTPKVNVLKESVVVLK